MVQLAVWGLKLDCPVVYYTQVDWGNPVIDFLASPFLGEEQPRSQGLSLLRGGERGWGRGGGGGGEGERKAL